MLLIIYIFYIQATTKKGNSQKLIFLFRKCRYSKNEEIFFGRMHDYDEPDLNKNKNVIEDIEEQIKVGVEINPNASKSILESVLVHQSHMNT
jgi:hypothetical protein